MTTEAKPKRSLVGIELVRLLANQGDRIFSIDRARELAPRAGVRDSYLGEALYHLRQTGWIVPLRRGLYALASTVPGVTPAHEFEVAMALADPAAISHWSALHYHGLTTQVPRTTFVLTTPEASVPRLSGTQRGTASRRLPYQRRVVYRFVQVRPGRFFGTKQVWVGDARVSITDLERTLVDGLTMPQHCGGFAEVLHAFEIAGPRVKRSADQRLCPPAGRGNRQAPGMGARTPAARSCGTRSAFSGSDQGLPQARPAGTAEWATQQALDGRGEPARNGRCMKPLHTRLQDARRRLGIPWEVLERDYLLPGPLVPALPSFQTVVDALRSQVPALVRSGGTR